jgi:DNA-binding NarL/FixJ family response regulator
MTRRTILYVEDEQWLMAGVVDYLAKDYNVIRARNADKALSFIESQEHKIDLIVLDIMMPQATRIRTSNHGRTSGVELARLLREEMKLNTPIVCYTVVDNRAVLNELRRIGVQEIVSKNRLPSDLEKVIRKHIR